MHLLTRNPGLAVGAALLLCAGGALATESVGIKHQRPTAWVGEPVTFRVEIPGAFRVQVVWRRAGASDWSGLDLHADAGKPDLFSSTLPAFESPVTIEYYVMAATTGSSQVRRVLD